MNVNRSIKKRMVKVKTWECKLTHTLKKILTCSA